MKNVVIFLLAHCLLPVAHCQLYWQQQTDYTIDVSLNDREKTLDGFERIVYTNHSPDTLRFIWFHLWPNAYKNDRTAFSDQMLENGNTKFYFSEKEERGYINRLDFKVDGAAAKTDDHPQHIDIIKVILPRPLPPNKSVSVTTPFHVKLPFNFSRSGYDLTSFQVTQWYPKPAVYDKGGWHPMPYLDQGEFYSEFGSFDVNITVPKDYAVAATGELQNEDEKTWLKARSGYKLPAPGLRLPNDRKPYRFQTLVIKNPVENKTLHFKQDRIHDFAWFADRNFIVNSDTVQLASGRTVQVSTFYTPLHQKAWKESLRYAKDAVRFYSGEVGEYPYNTATVVQGPESFGGGMEYPTMAVIAAEDDPKILDETIAHEIGHNWFYGALASNERAHPWMDEGMNTFYENRYMERKYGPQHTPLELAFQVKAATKTDQPIETASADLSEANYELVAYHKAAEWMAYASRWLGEDKFRQMMKTYYGEWAFKHPQPDDFKAVVRRYAGDNAEELLSLLRKKGPLPPTAFGSVQFINPLKKNGLNPLLENPSRPAVLVSPILGANSYDKLMLGGLLTNYVSPSARLKFLAAPMYATGSRSLVGLSKLNFAFFGDGFVRRADVFFNASSFTVNEVKDEDGKKHPMRFVKLVPGLRFTFKEGNPRSNATKWVQWKTFLFNEQFLDVSIDSIKTPTDTVIKFRYATPWARRYLNQLQFRIQNLRELYPFDVTLQAEQAQDFVRTTLTADYFFNYAKGGGLSVRFFAGAFSYLGEKTSQKQFANDRYHLNLSGANGYEDYTYSDYFVGRNKFAGLASQQIMIRDGAFKVRTDLLASKVGKTDEWLMAANFSSTFPQKLNPLSVLPVKIPLRLFADVGSYAGAWNRDNEADRFLFDFGLHLPLFAETINICIPLFYSKVYRDYFKSTDNGFFKKISFSINLFNKDLKKLSRETDIH